MSDVVIDDLYVSRRLMSIAKSASDRGLECSLSFNKLKKLLKTKRCYFSKVAIFNGIEGPEQLTIDRLDNSKGYTDDNVVVCSKEFNQNVKRAISIQEVKMLYKGLEKAKLI